MARGPRPRPDLPERRRPLGDHAAALVARKATEDRERRQAVRREEVEAVRRALARRRRLLLVLGVAAGACVGGVAGALLYGVPGALVGVLLGGQLAGIPELVARVAARRGPKAWDWKAQRHRAIGDPSKRVRGPEPDAPVRDPRAQR